MNNYIKGFLVSLALHSLVCGAFFAFAGSREPHRELLAVDFSFVTLGGSGSGNPLAAGGGGGEAASAFAGRTAAGQTPETSPEEAEIAREAGPPVAENKSDREPEPPVTPVAQMEKVAPEPEPAKPEEAVTPVPEQKKEIVRPEKKTRKPKNILENPKEGQNLAAFGRQAGNAPDVPGPPGPGKDKGAYGKGGGNSGGSGGGQGGAGGGGSSGYVKANFGYIQRYIRQHLEYPRQARIMNQTGVAHYSFVIERSGRVSSVNVVKSSGFPLLDKAGVKAINAASPLPAPPEPARISMPISFSLR